MIRAFPNLEDLRLWTSVPLRSADLASSDFPKLHSVLLGGLHSNRILRDLVRVVGHQLTALKIETVLSEDCSVPLGVVGNACPNLAELQVVNARVALASEDHQCGGENSNASFFSNLKLVYLFLVQYMVEDRRRARQGEGIGRPVSPLHCLLRHARAIEGVQATGCPGKQLNIYL